MKETCRDINVLGTTYSVLFGTKESKDMKEMLERGNDAECDRLLKHIRVCVDSNDSYYSYEGDIDNSRIVTVRMLFIHELTHAYIYESGIRLPEDQEESICEWLSIMLPKMLKTMSIDIQGFNANFVLDIINSLC